MNNDLAKKLKELRIGYLNKLKESYPDFKALAKEEPLNIKEIYSKVHTIAGTSGMYGLKDLSDISTEFEFYLKPIKENPNLIEINEFKDKFSNYLKEIQKIIGE